MKLKETISVTNQFNYTTAHTQIKGIIGSHDLAMCRTADVNRALGFVGSRDRSCDVVGGKWAHAVTGGYRCTERESALEIGLRGWMGRGWDAWLRVRDKG